MAYDTETGEAALRAENVEKFVRGFALQQFRMKQVFMTPSSKSWTETYYRETATELTAGTDVARMAAFPTAFVEYEKISNRIRKFGLETEVSVEDELMNNIDVIARSQLRISRAIARSVDTYLWDILSEERSVSAINNVSIAAANVWNASTRTDRHPQDDIGNAAQLIAENNYEANTLIVNPLDWRLLITNDDVLDAYTPTSNLMQNGKVANGVYGFIMGLKTIVNPVVTADYALVCEAKTCGTYKQVVNLKVEKELIAGIKHKIRAYEMGVGYLTDPKAVCLLTNTNA